MKRLINKIWNIIKNFAIFIWNLVKNMKTWRGILSLFIAFMILEGWALVFIGLGVWLNINWMYVSGITVFLFWFGPGTPLIPLIVLFGLFIQRYVFRDKSNVELLKNEWQKFKRNKRKRQLLRKLRKFKKETNE